MEFDRVNIFAPVVVHETPRMIFAIATSHSLIIECADVNNAYQYSLLGGSIIIEQPTNPSKRLAWPGQVFM